MWTYGFRNRDGTVSMIVHGVFEAEFPLTRVLLSHEMEWAALAGLGFSHRLAILAVSTADALLDPRASLNVK